MQKCGIYKIECLVSGKVYIGQSKDITSRWRAHKKDLTRGCHNNIHLQRSWDKHGQGEFIFKILIKCSEEELNEKEIYFIERYKAIAELYNLTEGGYGLNGFNHTEETKAKLRIANIGKRHTEETRQKMSKANKGKNNGMYGKRHSEETRKKLSEASTGKSYAKGAIRTAETRRKLSEAGKGRKQSDETKRKKLESRKWYKHSDETKQKIKKSNIGKNLGKTASEEAKRKMSEAHKGSIPWNMGIPASEEIRKKMSVAMKGREQPAGCGMKGKTHSEATKIKMSKAQKGKPKSEEQKRKQSETMKAKYLKRKIVAGG